MHPLTRQPRVERELVGCRSRTSFDWKTLFWDLTQVLRANALLVSIVIYILIYLLQSQRLQIVLADCS